jgi:hypothetical protein
MSFRIIGQGVFGIDDCTHKLEVLRVHVPETIDAKTLSKYFFTLYVPTLEFYRFKSCTNKCPIPALGLPFTAPFHVASPPPTCEHDLYCTLILMLRTTVSRHNFTTCA